MAAGVPNGPDKATVAAVAAGTGITGAGLEATKGNVEVVPELAAAAGVTGFSTDAATTAAVPWTPETASSVTLPSPFRACSRAS